MQLVADMKEQIYDILFSGMQIFAATLLKPESRSLFFHIV